MMQREKLFGADVDLSAWSALPLRGLLFGEAQSRVVLSTPKPEVVLAVAKSHGVPARQIGRVTASSSPLRVRVGSRSWDAPLASLADAYHEAIPRVMGRSAS